MASGFRPNDLDLELRAVSPWVEMGAYEALWRRPRTTFKSLAKKFGKHPGSRPSDFLTCDEEWDEAHECAEFVKSRFNEAGIGRFGVEVHGAGEYPMKLRDAEHPIELLYHQGWWDLVYSPSVAVVGTRKPSGKGLKRTRKLVRKLVEGDFTIVSGLAAGIDRMAHETAIENDGRTIAVLGTPLSHVYPKENCELQRRIAKEFLVVSQVPVRRYESTNDPRSNRFFFPERNITMSALTDATIIVEAGENSGTMVQARAALAQDRKLFILASCFEDRSLNWPARLLDKGAIQVRDYDEILERLSATIQ